MSLQKKLAAKILKRSEKKVWIDPNNQKVNQAITRRDIRRFIKEGIIKTKADKKKKTAANKAQQRRGSIKGSRKARIGNKAPWLRVVRPQRRLLKELKDKGQLKPYAYRKVYRLIKGNAFRSKLHLTNYLKDKKLLTDDKK